MLFSNLSDRNLRLIFYSTWLLLSCASAFLIQLHPDEAYYWMYSREMAWGYFDHPPVIAALIKVGFAIINHEIGVRLLNILLFGFYFYMIEVITKPGNLKLFYTLIFSVGLFHFYGFMATPDAPLLLSCTLIFYFFGKNSKLPAWQSSILLGVFMAFGILSKYHSGVFILLLIVSDPKVLKNKYLWMSFCVSAVLLTPHVMWQLNHDFPSFRYHLMDRSSPVYDPVQTLEYIGVQLILYGPLFGILFPYFVYRHKPVNQNEKRMKYIIYGGYLFFLLLSFKGRIEPHWTLFLSFPIIYICYKFIEGRKRLQNMAYYTLPVTLVITVVLKLLVMGKVDFLKSKSFNMIRSNFDHRTWVNELENYNQKDLPVVFVHSYQNASVYQFYSGEKTESYSINGIMDRHNQFDIWNTNEQLDGRKILLIPNYHHDQFDYIRLPYGNDSFPVVEIDEFWVLKGLKGEIKGVNIWNNKDQKHLLDLDYSILCTDQCKATIDNSKNATRLFVQVYKYKKMVFEDMLLDLNSAEFDQNYNKQIHLSGFELPSGKYDVMLVVKNGFLPPKQVSPIAEFQLE